MGREGGGDYILYKTKVPGRIILQLLFGRDHILGKTLCMGRGRQKIVGRNSRKKKLLGEITTEAPS